MIDEVRAHAWRGAMHEPGSACSFTFVYVCLVDGGETPCEPVILTEDHDQLPLFLKSVSSIRYIMPTDMGMSEIRDGLSLISDTGFFWRAYANA